MPSKPNVIATKTVSGAVHVFDYTKHPSTPDASQRTARPELSLLGHEKEGYGLAWSPMKPGALLSGADDALICKWDVEATTRTARELQPLSVFKGHSAMVEDVAWHPLNEHFFGSVG